jgi:hypothetical protein
MPTFVGEAMIVAFASERPHVTGSYFPHRLTPEASWRLSL